MDLPPHIFHLIAHLLDLAVEDMQNNGCNDLAVSTLERRGIHLTQEQLIFFRGIEEEDEEDEEVEDDEDDHEPKKGPKTQVIRWLSDVQSMRQAAKLLRGEAVLP